VQKPKFVLIDTDIVLRTHILGIWTELKKACRICVPATVAEEAKYFRGENRIGGIDLRAEAEADEIEVLEATITELHAVTRDFSEAFVEALHAGELEGLALLCSGRYEELVFCTGDVCAMQAAGMLGVDRLLISLEALVTRLGLKAKLATPLSKPLHQSTLEHHALTGKQRRLTREYFKQ